MKMKMMLMTKMNLSFSGIGDDLFGLVELGFGRTGMKTALGLHGVLLV